MRRLPLSLLPTSLPPTAAYVNVWADRRKGTSKARWRGTLSLTLVLAEKRLSASRRGVSGDSVAVLCATTDLWRLVAPSYPTSRQNYRQIQLFRISFLVVPRSSGLSGKQSGAAPQGRLRAGSSARSSLARLRLFLPVVLPRPTGLRRLWTLDPDSRERRRLPDSSGLLAALAGFTGAPACLRLNGHGDDRYQRQAKTTTGKATTSRWCRSLRRKPPMPLTLGSKAVS